MGIKEKKTELWSRTEWGWDGNGVPYGVGRRRPSPQPTPNPPHRKHLQEGPHGAQLAELAAR